MRPLPTDDTFHGLDISRSSLVSRQHQILVDAGLAQADRSMRCDWVAGRQAVG
jgi:hypothetical protein